MFEEVDIESVKVDIESVKVDIESVKVDIESAKVDIENKLRAFSNNISEKTISHAIEIFSKCGKDTYFGRTIVEKITGLRSSGASKLIKHLFDSESEIDAFMQSLTRKEPDTEG